MSALPARRVDLIPADAPFNQQQRAWLNGFFAALLTEAARASPGAAAPAVAQSATLLTIAYASQTGMAEGWSRQWSKRLKSHGWQVEVVALETLSLAALAERAALLVLASTYGEGEPPDSCTAFAAELAAATGQPLPGLAYAVLALGDRSYPAFCAFGQQLDGRLAELGASRIHALVEVDAGADKTFKSWQDSLLPVLSERFGHSASAAPEAAPDEDALDAHTLPGLSRDHPFGAVLLSNRRLNPGSDKETRHVVLSLAGAPLQYEPGDALGVWPRNDQAAVDAMLEVLGVHAETVVLMEQRGLSLREALSARCEIGRVSTATLLKFARHYGRDDLVALAETGGAPLAAFLDGRNVGDLLQAMQVQPAPQLLVDLLPRMTPRLYSIASSARAHAEEVHLTVGIARHSQGAQVRDGVASGYLSRAERLLGTVPVYLHRNARFRLPKDAGTPIIMIGPGTGIAPFRSFLEDRHAQKLTGRAWLFFGERSEAVDYLYRDELAAFLAAGTLSRLSTAFSRDGPNKVYVQDRMREDSAELWRWLEDGAVVYVCGDAARMARDVDETLCQILQQQGRMSQAKAQLELRHWSASGRYLRDVY